MIQDQIVVGIRNARLSEKLQLDPELTLEKAIMQARQAQAIKLQQPLLRGGSITKPDTLVGTVHKGRSGHRARQRSGATTRTQPGHRGSQNSGATTHTQPGSNTACSRCGKYPAHDQQHCPAKDATCHKTVCRSVAKVGGV